ncbi:MAG: PAS domain S-box protein [Deltaproteobacteria bacterium]|nr:PAS domain S-box protein [Deltaproteobacteria bacterium]
MKTVGKTTENFKRKTPSASVRQLINGTRIMKEDIYSFKDKSNKKIEKRKHNDWLQKSHLLFNHNPAAMALVSLPERKFIDVNDTFLKTFGFTRKEVIGKTIVKLNIFVHPEKHRNIVQQLQEQGNIENFELKVRRKDDTILEGLFSAEIIERQGEKYFLIVMIDMTSRKQSEKAQRDSEEKYRTILESTEESYYEIDLAGNLTFFNNSVCKLLGYSREELMGMNNRHYTDKETAKKVFQAFNKVYRTGEPTKEFDWQIIRKDGTKRYIEQSASLQKDSSGKPIGFRGIIHDITERKHTEELLRQSEAKYRLLADHVKDQVWLMDLNLKITYISPSVEKLLGYNIDEFIELPLDKILTAMSLQKAMEFFSIEMAKALKVPQNKYSKRLLELEFRSKDGLTLWIECAFSFIRDKNGRPVSILGEGRNVTERKQVEDSLRKSEENFHHSLDDSPLGVRIVTQQGETIYANKAVLDIYGYDSVKKLQKAALQNHYTPKSYADFQQRKEKRLRGVHGPSEYEISIVRKNGEVRHVHVFRKEIFWNGQIQSQVIYQDVTKRRKAEEKLNKTLESLRRSIKTTIQVLGIASEARDPYTAGHQRRVADLARAIATEMKLSQEIIEGIRMAGAIHDIGKISIPSEILCKPTILTDLEFSLVKAHSKHSYDIIKDVESPWPLANIVYQHHERINGSGYPQGLKDEDILIEARILAVADVVEAMLSYRPYRPVLGIEIALAEIEHNAGILYDSEIVEACLRLFREKGFKLE